MPKCKRYSPLYNSLLLAAVVFMLACGPGLYDDNEFSGYFLPTSAYTPPGAEPYYYSPAFLYTGFYEYWDAPAGPAGDPLLEAWKRYAGAEVSDSGAAALIYEGKDEASSALFRALHARPAAWSYLTLAREIEKATAAGGTVWEPTPADSASMKRLYGIAQDSAATEKDPFLRDKYCFQAIKLAHLLHFPDTCIRLYDRYFGKSTDSSLMRFWSLSHVGGAELALGDSARGIYVFAQVFDRCPSRRKQAYMSLRLRGLRFVPAALDYCRNDRERIAVYTLCAIQPWQDGLPLMDSMVRIDPNTPYLELIMSREINKNEDVCYQNPEAAYFRDTTGTAARRAGALSYFEKLGRFASQCAGDDRFTDQAFWNAAAAYVSYVQKDYDAAGRYLHRAEADGTAREGLRRQLLLEKLLVTTDASPTVTGSLEKQVWPLLDSLKHTESFYEGNALALACAHLRARYKLLAAGTGTPPRSWFSCGKPAPGIRRYATAKALVLAMLPSSQVNQTGFMSSTDQYGIEDTTSEATLDSTIAFFEQRNPSPEDAELMRISGLDLNYLYLVKGRRSLARFDFAKAAAAWRPVADSFWQDEPFRTYLAANPFSDRILDTHAPAPEDTARYTPYAFALRMQQLAEAAHTRPGEAARDYYLLGCGAYQMSYFGNSWLLVKRSWGSSDLEYGRDTQSRAVDSLNYYSTLRAQAYFDSAMRAAGPTELGAKACFMAAKCEQNQFYNYAAARDLMPVLHGESWGPKEKNDSLKAVLEMARDSGFHRYFSLLKTRYPGAAFTAEVIRQCATYRDFAEGR